MHFRTLEIWRLAAALTVMMWHFLRYAPPGHEAASNALYRLMPLMEMFFMISGFLIMLRYADTLMAEPGSFRRFIVRRLARLYPLYLVTLLFFCVVAAALHFGLVQTQQPERYAWAVLPANLLLVQAWGLTDNLTFNYVSWTLSAEWFCYLALPVIVLAYRRHGRLGLAVVAASAVSGLELAVMLGWIPFPSWLEANTWGAYRAFADFALGAMVAVAMRDSRLKLSSHLPGWLTFALAIAAMATQQNAYVIVLLLAAAMFLAALAERNNPDGALYLKPLHPFGRVSFGIYMIHPVIETLLLALVWRKLVEPLEVIGFYTFWLVPAATVMVVAMASDRYFEGPVSQYLNSRLGVEKPKAARRRIA
ncbi:acyltransferase family protein [Aminobacter ciceronei]|uniref:Peptidoglycan/LPS O-acetylase OafA/YrhL n=1 Tax=Aminobacter ciceronei TaxID=150723 RepID=A0ABR6C966_9HYPH|nr:acyltransferase [Aminobacter ciceronei]MBA8907348.1 peptidoglycan/LPS O-acetylase OafA/YrhL [Aminobacter ciceronei]MBA9021120.1 peptidoglycan/LPS O-acetylase OafA/YrhL [Aminobacter ciceronei]